MRVSPTSVAVAVYLSVAAAQTGFSQSQKNYVRGVVADSLGNPIVYANVQINSDSRATTDQIGAFRLEAPKDGKFLLTVRRLGYKPFGGEFHAPGDSTIRVVMDWVVKTLEPVHVAEHAVTSLETHGFYARMVAREQGRNSGYFITPEEIEVRQPTLTSQMLRGMPGIEVARVGSSSPPKWMVFGQNGCVGNVFVNGTRTNMLTSRSKMEEATSAVFDDIVPTGDLAGIEVYTRGTRAPAQYQALNGSCAVVLIWTK